MVSTYHHFKTKLACHHDCTFHWNYKARMLWVCCQTMTYFVNFANGQSEETLEWKISCCTVFILVIVLVIRVSQKQPGFHTSNQHFKSGVGRRRTKGSGGMPLSPLIFTFSEVDSEAMFSTLSVKICQVLVLPTGSTTDSSLEGLGEGGYPEWGKEGYPPPLYIASWAEPNPREKRRVGRHVYTRICSTARILQSNQIAAFKCPM